MKQTALESEFYAFIVCQNNNNNKPKKPNFDLTAHFAWFCDAASHIYFIRFSNGKYQIYFNIPFYISADMVKRFLGNSLKHRKP